MPCEECVNGKWKFGKTGECRWDTEAECDEANEGKKMEQRAEHTCIECENGKFKINEDGDCEFDTLSECQAAERAINSPQPITGLVKKFDRAKAEETRTIPFIASTTTEDRHGTVLNQANWDLKNFNSNPIIGYQHNVYGGDMCNAADPDDVIGKGVASIVSSTRATGGQQLDIDITFEPKELNEKADKIFRKILNGTLNAVSVGFIPKGEGRYGQLNSEGETINKETYYYDGQELLEVSVVNIPSNAEALTKTVRNSTFDGIMFLKRFFGDKLSFSQIEKLTVGQIVKALDTGEAPVLKDCGCHDKEEKKEETAETKEESSENEEKGTGLLNVRRKRLDLIEKELNH